jgi:hypothetical protein
MQYAWNTVLAVIRYRRTVGSGRVYPEYAEYASGESAAIPSAQP